MFEKSLAQSRCPLLKPGIDSGPVFHFDFLSLAVIVSVSKAQSLWVSEPSSTVNPLFPVKGRNPYCR